MSTFNKITRYSLKSFFDFVVVPGFNLFELPIFQLMSKIFLAFAHLARSIFDFLSFVQQRLIIDVETKTAEVF